VCVCSSQRLVPGSPFTLCSIVCRLRRENYRFNTQAAESTKAPRGRRRKTKEKEEKEGEKKEIFIKHIVAVVIVYRPLLLCSCDGGPVISSGIK